MVANGGRIAFVAPWKLRAMIGPIAPPMGMGNGISWLDLSETDCFERGANWMTLLKESTHVRAHGCFGKQLGYAFCSHTITITRLPTELSLCVVIPRMKWRIAKEGEGWVKLSMWSGNPVSEKKTWEKREVVLKTRKRWQKTGIHWNFHNT